jgi:hypothetical protein
MKVKIDSVRKSFVHVFGGNVLTENFFVRNLTFIVVLVIIMILFISHRYTVLQRIAEMERLKVELKDAKYESLLRGVDRGQPPGTDREKGRGVGVGIENKQPTGLSHSEREKMKWEREPMRIKGGF